jgi:phage/plasmid primase-like uncharacterized protein
MMILRIKMMCKRYSILVATFLLFLLASLPVHAAIASDESEVRGVVQASFEQLKSGQYDQLYDSLPAASKSKVSRERFTDALNKSRGKYNLERIEIGAVHVSGNIAVVDTVMYGSVQQPVQAEGKIVSQLLLTREDGRWRIAIGDTATTQRLLAANPAFAKTFQLRAPHTYMKQNGRWVDITTLIRQARRAG